MQSAAGRMIGRKSVGKPDNDMQRFRTLIDAHRDSGWIGSRQVESRRDKSREKKATKKD
jgi:hypothetical protein